MNQNMKIETIKKMCSLYSDFKKIEELIPRIESEEIKLKLIKLLDDINSEKEEYYKMILDDNKEKIKEEILGLLYYQNIPIEQNKNLKNKISEIFDKKVE